MRSLFLILLLVNLVAFAIQFDVVRGFVTDTVTTRPTQLNAERLRIVRDTSARIAPTAPAAN